MGGAFPVVLFGALATLVNEAGVIPLATRRRVGLSTLEPDSRILDSVARG